MQRTGETTYVPVSADGVRLCVMQYGGTGPTVIMLHGITSSGADFAPVLEEMQMFCRPVVVDLRGHGSSDKPASGYHYRDYVADLNAVIRTMHLVRPIVLGHSLGGIIAMYWAAQQPGSARALIIEDSPLRSGEDFRGAFDGWLALNAMSSSDLRAWYAAKNPGWNDTVLDARTTAMKATSRQAITELMRASMARDGLDDSPVLAKITDPILYLHGDLEYGSMVHPDDLADLPNRNPTITVKRVPGSGHTLHRSHPEAWLHHVRTFLQELES